MRVEVDIYDKDHNPDHCTKFVCLQIPHGRWALPVCRLDRVHIDIEFDHITDLQPIADAINAAIERAGVTT